MSVCIPIISNNMAWYSNFTVNMIIHLVFRCRAERQLRFRGLFDSVPQLKLSRWQGEI